MILCGVETRAASKTSDLEEQFGMVLDLPYHPTFKRVTWLVTSHREDPIVGVRSFWVGRDIVSTSYAEPHWDGSLPPWSDHTEFRQKMVGWAAGLTGKMASFGARDPMQRGDNLGSPECLTSCLALILGPTVQRE